MTHLETMGEQQALFSERAAFEAWAAQRWGREAHRHISATCAEWDAWQAAAASVRERDATPGVGELVATLDVHHCATAATQERRMREARMMAAAPDLLAALEELMYARTDKAEKMTRDAIYKAVGAA